MMELTFAQSFSLIALNAQDSIHLPTSKKVALRCIAAAIILELYLENKFSIEEDVITLYKDQLQIPSITLYEEAVLKSILARKKGISGTLSHFLSYVTELSDKQLEETEHTLADSLMGIHALEEIPSLLGCDLQFKTAGIVMKEYRSNAELYRKLTESLRAEILEDGVMTDETILMLWLLRESGCLYDIFSMEELKRVASRISELLEGNILARKVLFVNIHKSFETAIKRFLNIKREIMSTNAGSGVNFAFPFFQRSQSVFIDTEALFENKEARLRDVKARLQQNGHTFTVLRKEKSPLLR